MDESKKTLVSLRLCHADLEKLEKIARRLRVRESEIIRFALRLTFTKLALLLDENARGRDLIPIFVECGPELTYHFDLDPQTLDNIVNGALDDPRKRVDGEDIELIARLHISGFHPRTKIKGPPKLETERRNFTDAPRHYLYEKYIGPNDGLGGINGRASSLQIPL